MAHSLVFHLQYSSIMNSQTDRQTDYSGQQCTNKQILQNKEIATTQRIGLICGVDFLHCVAACFCCVVTSFRCVQLIRCLLLRFCCVAACFHCVVLILLYCSLFPLCCNLFPLCCGLFPLCCAHFAVLWLVSIVLQIVSIVLWRFYCVVHYWANVTNKQTNKQTDRQIDRQTDQVQSILKTQPALTF